ncbi:MAG: efflux RND transporter periplasmic adaptor subunit [Xanthobacteraceae bacterium]|nr:efflux RND transporter periplasmic adaptor subunit [Xanthobacteraceae bacterium]
MPKRTRLFSQPAGIVSALCAVFIAGGFVPAQGQPAAAPQAVPVGTVRAEHKPVSRANDFVGRIEAINRVQVRARVTGYLEAILFKEGDTIKENAPVYRLEKGQFEAAVKQAEGALERAKAAKVLTAVQLQRAEDLLTRASGTEVARDQALAADQQAAGSILEAEANLQTAQINLGYTDITSPIVGKIGRTSVTRGNVVGPDTGTLTTIVSQDPMYVTFPVSQRDFLRAQQSGHQPNLQDLKVRLRYADGTEYAETGMLNFVDVSVDRGTDTVTVRATVPNPKGGLIDGQLMRVVVEADKPEEKIVIPQSALIADQEGVYIFVVQDGKAAVRRVKTGGGHGTGVVIEEGLKGGELVIVQGLQSVRPGAPVRATPAAQMPGQG